MYCIYLTWGNNLVQPGHIKHGTCVVGINCSLWVLFSAMLLFGKQNHLFAETTARTTNLKRSGDNDFPMNILGWKNSNEWNYDNLLANHHRYINYYTSYFTKLQKKWFFPWNQTVKSKSSCWCDDNFQPTGPPEPLTMSPWHIAMFRREPWPKSEENQSKVSQPSWRVWLISWIITLLFLTSNLQSYGQNVAICFHGWKYRV